MEALNDTQASNISTASGGDQGATILSPLLLFGTGVLGNILAIVTLHRKDTNIITAKFYTLIIGLAWTDLVGIIITTPSVLLTYLNDRRWVGGDEHCVFHGFTMTCFALASPLILCAMAIERFMSIRFVFCYTTKCRKSTARYVILAIWIGVLAYGALPLLGFGAYELEYPGTWCFFDFHSNTLVPNLYAYIFASVNIILIVIMIMCNSFVIITLVSKRVCVNRQDGWTSPRKHLPSQSRKAKISLETQMIVLLCSITTVFVLCWAPLMIQIIVTMATGQGNALLDLLAIRLASLNQVLDPWLYILLRRSFCRRIKRFIRRLCRHGTVERPAKHSDNTNALLDEKNRVMCAQNFQLPVNTAPDFTRHSSSRGSKSKQTLPDVTKTHDEKPAQFVYRVSFINRCPSANGRSCGHIDVNVSMYPKHAAQRSAVCLCVRNSKGVTSEAPVSCPVSRGSSSSEDRSRNVRSSVQVGVGVHSTDQYSDKAVTRSTVHSPRRQNNTFS